MLKYIGGGLEIVAELADLTNPKSFEELAALGEVLLSDGHPELPMKFSLLGEPVEAFDIAQQAQAQR